MPLFVQQVRVLLQKQWWLYKRNASTTILKLAVPVLFMLASLIVLAPFWTAVNEHPVLSPPITDLPKCIPYYGLENCTTLAYNPSNNETDAIMRILAKQNNPPLEFGVDVKSTDLGIEEFKNYTFFQAPNSTMAAVFFYYSFPSSKWYQKWTNKTFYYNLLYNNSLFDGRSYNGDSGNPLNFQLNSNGNGGTIDTRTFAHASIQRAIATYWSGADMKITMKDFPEAPNSSGFSTNIYLQGMIIFLVYIATAVTPMSLINSMLFEKQMNISVFLKCCGLKPSAHWTAWFIGSILFHIVVMAIIFIFGYGLPRIELFRNTNFFVLFFVLSGYGISLISFSFFVSVFVNTARSANIFLASIIALGLGWSVTTPVLGSLVYQFWTIPGAGAKIGLYSIYCFPPFHFIKCLTDIYVRACGDPYSIAWGSNEAPVIPLSFTLVDFRTRHFKDVPSCMESLGIMMLFSIAYFILAWYFDYIVNDNRWAKTDLFFFLKKSFWFPKKLQNVEMQHLRESGDSINRIPLLSEEQEGLHVKKLSKKFRHGKHAVKDLTTKSGNRGELMVTLGPNGAGKSTMLNVLSGLTNATSGDAIINGRSVDTEMDQIRQMLGICPQNDVFWPNLTAREHLYILARMKEQQPNVTFEQEVNTKLEEVLLTKVADYQIQTYSGGMRRRLMVALSTISKAGVIFLDEPTTGIDVMNRQYVWKMVNNIKKNRVMVLVTHSHEEANTLADKIIIISNGQLKCEGTPQELKHQINFSKFLNLHILVETAKVNETKQAIAQILPDATLLAENAGSLAFSFSEQNRNQVELFAFLQKNTTIKDWKLSSTTMEDVFLKVMK